MINNIGPLNHESTHFWLCLLGRNGTNRTTSRIRSDTVTQRGLERWVKMPPLISAQFRAVFYMRRCNHMLFTFWQCRYSIMLQLKLEMDFKDETASCVCSDNQEGSSVFHNLIILNGTVVYQITRNITSSSERLPSWV